MNRRVCFLLILFVALAVSRNANASFHYKKCLGKMGPSGSSCAPSGFDSSIQYQEDDVTRTLAPRPSDNPPNVLFVFLPGTGAKTKSYKHLVARAEKVGYHIIVLSYWNQHHLHLSAGCDPVGWARIHDLIAFGVPNANITTTNTYGNPGGIPLPAPIHFCNQIHDESCTLSTMSGEHTALADKNASGNFVLMDPASSIKDRLTKVLQFLSTNADVNNWSQFLDGDKPNWSKIVLAGQSQGAGQAAFIAKWVKLKRVIMLSGIIDSLDYPQASDWPSCAVAPNSGAVAPGWVVDNQFGGDLSKTKWQTDLQDIYGLASILDQDFWLDSLRIKTNWDTLTLSTLGTSGGYPLIDGFDTTNLQLNGEHGLTIGADFTCRSCGSCPAHFTAGTPDTVPHFATGFDDSCNNGGTLSTTNPHRPAIVKAWDFFLSNPLGDPTLP